MHLSRLGSHCYFEIWKLLTIFIKACFLQLAIRLFTKYIYLFIEGERESWWRVSCFALIMNNNTVYNPTVEVSENERKSNWNETENVGTQFKKFQINYARFSYWKCTLSSIFVMERKSLILTSTGYNFFQLKIHNKFLSRALVLNLLFFLHCFCLNFVCMRMVQHNSKNNNNNTHHWSHVLEAIQENSKQK